MVPGALLACATVRHHGPCWLLFVTLCFMHTRAGLSIPCPTWYPAASACACLQLGGGLQPGKETIEVMMGRHLEVPMSSGKLGGNNCQILGGSWREAGRLRCTE